MILRDPREFMGVTENDSGGEGKRREGEDDEKNCLSRRFRGCL